MRHGFVGYALPIFQVFALRDGKADPEGINRRDHRQSGALASSDQAAHLRRGNARLPAYRRIDLGVVEIDLCGFDVGLSGFDSGSRGALTGFGVIKLLAADRIFGRQRNVAGHVVPGLLQLRFSLRELPVSLGQRSYVRTRIDRVEKLAGINEGSVFVILGLQET